MYKSLYKQLIDKARADNRKKNEGTYYEKHHIVPDFLYKNRKRRGPTGHLDGNPNSKDNIVLLTFSEHLMAHYYLYEIYKGTHYEYSAGSALQFFFVKATGSHKRQVHLSEIDEQFLKDMEHLRVLGIESISKARKGKMPVVDVITRESIGSVAVDHPKVLSGEWVHHSKGKKQTWEPRSMKGSNNTNYREMTEEHRKRLWNCVLKSVSENHFIYKKFEAVIKEEFTEFNKISGVWVFNNYGSIYNLIDETNKNCDMDIKYNPHFRSAEARKRMGDTNKQKKWYTNGIDNKLVSENCLNELASEYRRGMTK